MVPGGDGERSADTREPHGVTPILFPLSCDLRDLTQDTAILMHPRGLQRGSRRRLPLQAQLPAAILGLEGPPPGPRSDGFPGRLPRVLGLFSPRTWSASFPAHTAYTGAQGRLWDRVRRPPEAVRWSRRAPRRPHPSISKLNEARPKGLGVLRPASSSHKPPK